MVRHGPCPLQVGTFVGTICLGLATGVTYSTSKIIIPTLQSLPSASTAHQALTTLKSHVRQKTQWLTGTTACTFFIAYRLASKAKGRKHPYLLYVSTLAMVGGWGIQSWYDGGVVYEVLRQPLNLVMKNVRDVVVLLGLQEYFTTGPEGTGSGSACWDWSYGLGCLPPNPSNMSASPSSLSSSSSSSPPLPSPSTDMQSRASTSSSSSTTMIGSGKGRQYTPSVSIANLTEEDASASLAGSGVFVVNGNGREEPERNGDREVMTPSFTSRPATPTPNGESVARMIDAEERLQRASLNTLGVAFVMAIVGIWGDSY